MQRARPLTAVRPTTAYSSMWAAIVVGALALCSSPGYAHHSFAAYDQRVTRMVSGTLKEFDWDAPHSGMTVAYLNAKGAMKEVSVTTGSPAIIVRQGFKPNDFRVGMRVTMSWHPNRNGLPGGELVELKLEDGRVLHGGFPSVSDTEKQGVSPPAPRPTGPAKP